MRRGREVTKREGGDDDEHDEGDMNQREVKEHLISHQS